MRNHRVLVAAGDVGKSSLLRLLDLLLGASVAQLYAHVGFEDMRDRASPLEFELYDGV